MTRFRPARLARTSPTSARATMSVESLVVGRPAPRSRPRRSPRSATRPGPRSDELGEGRPDLLGDRHGLLEGRPVEDREELLAAVAGDDVRAAEPAAEDVGEGAQDRVAGLVAVALVDLAEVVEVEDRDRRPIAGLGRAPGASRPRAGRSSRRGGGG